MGHKTQLVQVHVKRYFGRSRLAGSICKFAPRAAYGSKLLTLTCDYSFTASRSNGMTRCKNIWKAQPMHLQTFDATLSSFVNVPSLSL